MLRFKRKANAQMVKSVDTLVSGTSARKGVQVRVLFWALLENENPLDEYPQGFLIQNNNQILFCIPYCDYK